MIIHQNLHLKFLNSWSPNLQQRNPGRQKVPGQDFKQENKNKICVTQRLRMYLRNSKVTRYAKRSAY